MGKSYWNTIKHGTPEQWEAEREAKRKAKKQAERNALINKARAKFPSSTLSELDILNLTRRWGLTLEEIIANWDIYPCNLLYAARRQGCGCTGPEPHVQFCAKDRTRDEIIKKFPDCL